MTDGIVPERVPSPGGSCWICGGSPAVCGIRGRGRFRRRVRGLCQAHADALFGADDPPWRRMDARTQRDIVEEWLRGITILAGGSQEHRPMDEILTEIAEVNGAGAEPVRLVSPLMPGEARDLHESLRAQAKLRGRETMVHAVITQILISWLADASGQTRSEVIQRLALTLNDWFDARDTDP